MIKSYMIMNNVYFSNEGLSSTSGQYYCNIAKELIQSAKDRLENVRFYRTSVAVIGANDKQIMAHGNTDLGFIDLDLQEVASMNSFCAWVREAIKEKENQQKEIKDLNFVDWAEQQGIELPKSPIYPDNPYPVLEEDVINSWDINKRNKYLRLEAFASTYGKYIHPDGAYSKARKKAYSAFNNPITKEGTGRDMILYYMEPSVNINDVDYVFMELQSKYRGYEKELNQMKAEIKDTVNEWQRKINDEYQIKIDEWKVLDKNFNSAMAELRNQFNTWRTNELERISKLKITIPDSLKDVFKTIREVGDTSK